MKKHLLSGLLILMPLVLTILVIGFLFKFLTTPFLKIVEPLLTKAPFVIPVELSLFVSRLLVLIFLVLLIFLLGIIARWFFIKHLLSFTHKILYRIPFIRTVYKVSRDVISALFSTDGKKAFKRPILIPFPGRPTFAIGFQAGEVAKECQEKISTPLTSVFLPTAPHPISGFFFLIPEKDTHPLDMTNEDALKFLVSCGMIRPANETSHE